MWIVYQREDTYVCGFEVETEKEAVDYCKANDGYTYIYVEPYQGMHDDYEDFELLRR